MLSIARLYAHGVDRCLELVSFLGAVRRQARQAAARRTSIGSEVPRSAKPGPSSAMSWEVVPAGKKRRARRMQRSSATTCTPPVAPPSYPALRVRCMRCIMSSSGRHGSSIRRQRLCNDSTLASVDAQRTCVRQMQGISRQNTGRTCGASMRRGSEMRLGFAGCEADLACANAYPLPASNMSKVVITSFSTLSTE